MILYIDIETAPEHENYIYLPPTGQKAFEKKFHWMVDKGDYQDMASCYDAEAALHAEFSKIICIGMGMEVIDKEKKKEDYFFARALIGDETSILKFFDENLTKVKPDLLCAHNGKRFDYPFIVKRMLINGLYIPDLLYTGDKKPWEVNLLDTVEIWRGMDISNYTSLIALCHCFGVESPKNDLDGSKVRYAFYNGHIDDIRTYCLADVYALYQVHVKMMLQQPLTVVRFA